MLSTNYVLFSTSLKFFPIEEDNHHAGNGAESGDAEISDSESADSATESVGSGNEGDSDQQENAVKPEKDDAVVVLTEHSNETLAVAASPVDPTCLITGGMDDLGIIWDLNTQSSIANIDGAGDSVSTVSFSHDGKYAAFGAENGVISIVLMDGSSSPSSVLDGPGDAVHFLSWHPRGPVLLAGSADNVAYMWNAVRGTFMMAFAGHEGAVTCGSFTTDGKFVVTASNDSSLRVWNPTSGETILRLQSGTSNLRSAFHSTGILCSAVGNEETIGDKLIATGCSNGDVFISHRESGQVVSQLPRHEGGVECLAFSPSSITKVFLASAGADGVIRVWDIESSMERVRFSHGGVISKVVWHSQKPILLSGSSDGTVALWNVLSGLLLARLMGHESFITDVCFVGEDGTLASTSADGTVRIYKAPEHLSSF